MKDTKVDTLDLTKNDYPELEGKFVKYFDGCSTLSAVVIGCNRSVGITIVDANDKDRFFVCAAGPVLPDHNIYGDKFVKNYDKWFDKCIEGIIAGCVDGPLCVKQYDGQQLMSNCTGDNCAYRR